MNPADDKEIVRQLRADFASLTFSPAPVLAVTLRGKAIKARRRTTAVGAAVAVVAVLAAAS